VGLVKYGASLLARRPAPAPLIIEAAPGRGFSGKFAAWFREVF
jgi:hypothetical protein